MIDLRDRSNNDFNVFCLENYIVLHATLNSTDNFNFFFLSGKPPSPRRGLRLPIPVMAD